MYVSRGNFEEGQRIIKKIWAKAKPIPKPSRSKVLKDVEHIVNTVFHHGIEFYSDNFYK